MGNGPKASKVCTGFMSFNTYTTVKKHDADQKVFKPESKSVLEIFWFSPFHLCKLDIQVLSGKTSLSATDGKHMCRNTLEKQLKNMLF